MNIPKIMVVTVLALLTVAAPAHADSTADALLRFLNEERGGIKTGDSVDKCPCTVLGVHQPDDTTKKTVFLTTQDGSWWMFQCVALDTGEWHCGWAEGVHGTGAILTP